MTICLTVKIPRKKWKGTWILLSSPRANPIGFFVDKTYNSSSEIETASRLPVQNHWNESREHWRRIHRANPENEKCTILMSPQASPRITCFNPIGRALGTKRVQ